MTPQKRKQYGDDELATAVERVVTGGERAAVVGREQRIPYRTLLQYVSRRRKGVVTVSKRRGPPPALTIEGERQLLQWMRELQAAGLPVRRRELLVKANEVLKEIKGPEAVLSTGWYGRFRDRHPEISGPGAQLMVEATEGEERVEVHSEERQEALTPPERAVLDVQKSYGAIWPPQDVVDAFDVMLDVGKARMFAVMEPGELRDLWLRKQLRQMRARA